LVFEHAKWVVDNQASSVDQDRRMVGNVPGNRERQTVTLERGYPRVPLGAIIRVSGARATPREFRLAAGSCRLGAGKEVDIVIQDETVSRQHVELRVVPEGVELRDLGSRNGTFYLEQRVEKITLALGSRVLLGRVQVQIDPDSGALHAEGDDTQGPTQYGDLLGNSPAMRRLFASLTRLERGSGSPNERHRSKSRERRDSRRGGHRVTRLHEPRASTGSASGSPQ
jgi:hypothetical protein